MDAAFVINFFHFISFFKSFCSREVESLFHDLFVKVCRSVILDSLAFDDRL